MPAWYSSESLKVAVPTSVMRFISLRARRRRQSGGRPQEEAVLRLGRCWLCQCRICEPGRKILDGAQVARRSMQGRRGRLSEESLVRDRKAPQFPEAMSGGDLRHGRIRRIRLDKRAAREMHPPQPQIPNVAHAQVLLATSFEGAFRCTDRRTDFRQMHGPIAIRCQQFLEATDDLRV